MYRSPLFTTLSVALAMAGGLAGGATTSTYDFSAGNGGFSSSVVNGSATASWAYSGALGTWATPGSQSAVSVVTLTSPAFTVDAAGPVSGSLVHQFSFDTSGGGLPPSGLIYYDGGLIEYRVNGGSWVALSDSLVTGVTYGGVLTAGTGNPLEGSPAFVYDGSTLGTSNFSLGTTGTAQTFSAGDTVQIRFVAGFDSSSSPVPAWSIQEVTLTTAVPEASSAALMAAGVAGLLVARRRR